MSMVVALILEIGFSPLNTASQSSLWLAGWLSQKLFPLYQLDCRIIYNFRITFFFSSFSLSSCKACLLSQYMYLNIYFKYVCNNIYIYVRAEHRTHRTRMKYVGIIHWQNYALWRRKGKIASNTYRVLRSKKKVSQLSLPTNLPASGSFPGNDRQDIELKM